MNKLPLLLSLVAVAGLAQANLKSELTAARNKQEKATMALDKKGVEQAIQEFLAPNFKYVQDGKPQDSKTFISNTVEGIDTMTKISDSSMKIIALREKGSIGTGTIQLHMEGVMKGEDKKDHKLNWSGIFQEKYLKVDGKWKLAEMEAGKQTFLMDGKPVKM